MANKLKTAVVSTAILTLACAGGALSAPFQMTLKPAGTTTVTTPAFGTPSGGAQADEIDTALVGGDTDNGGALNISGGSVINRSIAKAPGKGTPTNGSGRAKSNPDLLRSFDGLNFYDQRVLANGGNQLSVEPPDQGLCVGNGFVMETVNDVIKIFDTAGNLKAGPIDQNTFYGYAPAIIRSGPNAGQRGPSVTDPSCLFDADTQRWFQVALTLDHVGTTASLNGNNHLDIAVSMTADPTGAWTIYHLPVQNNGTQGTPNHHCNNGFCLGDYPHIGADASGFYITTNEFALSGPGFYGAQIYALSKHALAALSASVPVVLIDTIDLPVPAFTVWPAQSVGTNFDADNGGTEFFLSSLAVFFDSGESNQLLVWSLTNTNSLDTASPTLGIGIKVLDTLTYSVPPPSNQKVGNTPLGDCVADPACPVATGAAFHFDNARPYPLDSNDSRMQQVYYANGKLWSGLDTGVNIAGDVDGSGKQITRAGVAYFVFNPNSGVIFQQGIVGLAGNNLNYPAVGVTASGRGVIAFTLVGNDNYPSAAYLPLDAKVGAGDIRVAAAGAGPADGFTGYFPLVSQVRPRWGDYGAAATDGNTIWIASEYIGQTCTYAAYQIDPTCGATRGVLGNWDTRITQVKP